MEFNTNSTKAPRAQVARIIVPERGYSSYSIPTKPIPNRAVSIPMANLMADHPLSLVPSHRSPILKGLLCKWQLWF